MHLKSLTKNDQTSINYSIFFINMLFFLKKLHLQLLRVINVVIIYMILNNFSSIFFFLPHHLHTFLIHYENLLNG